MLEYETDMALAHVLVRCVLADRAGCARLSGCRDPRSCAATSSFPQPDGPSNETKFAVRKMEAMLSSALKEPNVLLTPGTSMLMDFPRLGLAGLDARHST